MNFYDIRTLTRGRKKMERITGPLLILGLGACLICAYFAYRRHDAAILMFGLFGMVFWNTAVIFIADIVAYKMEGKRLPRGGR